MYRNRVGFDSRLTPKLVPPPIFLITMLSVSAEVKLISVDLLWEVSAVLTVWDPVKRNGDQGRGGAGGESDAGIGISTTYAHTTHDASTKVIHRAAADSGGVSACNQGVECITSVVTLHLCTGFCNGRDAMNGGH